LVALILSGCSFRMTFNGAPPPEGVSSVSVEYFPTKAPLAGPSVSHAFTEALRDIMNTQTSLDLVPKNGDLRYSGEITGFVVQPVAIQEGETAGLNRLTITVKVRFENTANEKKDFETSFTKYSDYSSSAVLSDVETQLVAEINELLVQDIYNKSLGDW